MNCKPFELGTKTTLWDLCGVAAGRKVVFGGQARRTVSFSRKALEALMKKGAPIYGVNTGFGELASQRIPPGKCALLQKNLLRSHACGVGEPLCAEETRGLMLVRANELARGHSAVRPEVVEILAACLNKGVIPYVPSKGSVGASGDLAPSSHAALVLIGEGRARIIRLSDLGAGSVCGGKWIDGAQAFKQAGIKPLALAEKEGLSLINGTQAMQSVGGLALVRALNVWDAALAASAMSVEALKGTPAPFLPELNELKPHPAQIETAKNLLELLEKSEIRQSHVKGDDRVQDPYSLRCIPQTHGAVLDAIKYSVETLEAELNGVTDNPVLVWSGGEKPDWETAAVLSGGNFHGQFLSLAFDFACAALTCLGNVSERRIFQLVSDSTGVLPPFLAKDPGVESGLMIAQCAAAALASENKILAHPASSDSIPTSGSKEDFVSMGMTAALKLKQVVENVSNITAIELLAAAKGVEFHKPLKPGLGVQATLDKVRALVPAVDCDHPLSDEIEKISAAVTNGTFLTP